MSGEAENQKARPWTTEEEEFLEQERKKEHSTPYKELVERMGRSNQALRLKMHHLERRRKRAERQQAFEEEIKKYGGEVEQLKPRRRVRTKSKSPVRASAEPRALLPADEKSPLSRKESHSDSETYEAAGGLMALLQSKRQDRGLNAGLTQTPAIMPPQQGAGAGSSQPQVAQGTYGQQTQPAGYHWGTLGSSMQGPAFPQQLAPYVPPMQQPVVCQHPAMQQYAPMANMGYGYPSISAAGPSTQYHASNPHYFVSNNRGHDDVVN